MSNQKWNPGRTLVTRETMKWSKEQVEANDQRESMMIFSDFSEIDDGRSRQIVATINPAHPEAEMNARLIEAAPDILIAAQVALHILKRAKNLEDAKDAIPFLDDAIRGMA